MTARILEAVTIRPANLEDAENLTDLYNACSMHDVGAPSATVERVRHELQMPIFNPQTDTWVAFSPDGQAIGYGEFFDFSEHHANYHLGGGVHPEYRGQGLGLKLRGLMEARAREQVAKAPPEARVSLNSGCVSTNEGARQMFIKTGLTYIRSFWRMRIDFDGPPPAAQLPEGFSFRTHVPGQDDVIAYEAFRDAFKDHWGTPPIAYEMFKSDMYEGPDYDPSLFFYAIDDSNGRIAGFSMCFPKVDEDPDMAWVGDLGVRREYRRKGIATAMLNHSFGEFYRRGKLRAGLGVDAQSLTGATKLYESVGMRPDREWQRFEKELRPGVELSTRELAE
jgi:mycothiol synthase